MCCCEFSPILAFRDSCRCLAIYPRPYEKCSRLEVRERRKFRPVCPVGIRFVKGRTHRAVLHSLAVPCFTRVPHLVLSLLPHRHMKCTCANGGESHVPNCNEVPNCLCILQDFECLLQGRDLGLAFLRSLFEGHIVCHTFFLQDVRVVLVLFALGVLTVFQVLLAIV